MITLLLTAWGGGNIVCLGYIAPDCLEESVLNGSGCILTIWNSPLLQLPRWTAVIHSAQTCMSTGWCSFI